MRKAEIVRRTKETAISVSVDIDGTGKYKINTGVGFFDHMLSGMARHGFLDLDVNVKGDLQVDDHHTIEDTGIVIGQAVSKAIGDKAGIRRFGSCILPMDETLVLVAIDLSGRPYFVSDAEFQAEMIGDMHSEMVNEFFYAISYSAAMNLHIQVIRGSNSHHIAEAIFKAFGRALDEATSFDERIGGVLSTKGSL